VAAVAELKPRALLMENVAALLFRRGITMLRQVVSELDKLGYTTSIAIVHAEGYGVPQLRRRFFLAAVSGGVQWPDPWCDLTPPGHFRLQPHRTDAVRRGVHTVRDAIADLPSRESILPDQPAAYASAAKTDYQRWIRGELATNRLVPDPSWVTAERSTLELATMALRTRI
jgi:DNA (cytosine-5)-methyltransferase 1